VCSGVGCGVDQGLVFLRPRVLSCLFIGGLPVRGASLVGGCVGVGQCWSGAVAGGLRVGGFCGSHVGVFFFSFFVFFFLVCVVVVACPRRLWGLEVGG